MRRVILESPYAGTSADVVERNIEYARACLNDCLQRGEAPIASHLLYTQPGVLDDAILKDRQLGIDAGHAWMVGAEVVVMYVDHGVSEGMFIGIRRAKEAGVPIEWRLLGVLPAVEN